MLQKVTHENIQNPGLYTLRKMDIAQFIIKKINISKPHHLLFTLGTIWKDG